jgi:23S rRNA C2498 (ribose-2'-O)-methylase RlmM
LAVALPATARHITRTKRQALQNRQALQAAHAMKNLLLKAVVERPEFAYIILSRTNRRYMAPQMPGHASSFLFC